MAKEYKRYHSQLAQLIAIKKESNIPKPSHVSEPENLLMY